jgi:hypothetical protein
LGRGGGRGGGGKEEDLRACSVGLHVVVMVERSAWRKGTDLQTQAMSVTWQPVEVIPARAASCCVLVSTSDSRVIS